MTKKVTKKKTTKKKTAKRGRPQTFKKEYVNIAKFMCDRGATDQEIADCLGVSERTINRWKKDKPEFCQSLKRGKDYFDNRVERALAERAIGYSHGDVHITNYQGKITKTEIIKHYPPDVTACIYWLNNRKAKEWASRKAVETEININKMPDGAGVLMTPPVMNSEDWIKLSQESNKTLTEKEKEFDENE